MAILTFTNLAQSFGAFDVFKGASGAIEAGSKIGLVGPNGIGKTTLLLLLTGAERPAIGSVWRGEDVRVGYLRQEAVQAFHDSTNTIWEEMLLPFAGVGVLEAEMRSLEVAMADDAHAGQVDDLLVRYGELQEQFETIGGYDYEVRIKSTLEGLGFSADMYGTPLGVLSGGQKTRALLARLLLERPNLLVLDEPTNHLDVEAVEWLEHTLRNYPGAVLIVSHDRYFLDVVVDTTWELTRDGIEAYRGNYSAYLRQRDERREYADKLYAQEMESLRAELDYVKRNIARASTNAQAVGRLRRLSRAIVAIQELGLVNYKSSKKWSDTGVGSVRMLTVVEAEEALAHMRSPVSHRPQLSLRLKSTFRSGDLVLRTRRLHVGYPDRLLFEMPDIILNRGETAALIGGNGTGKTTLLKTLLGDLQPLDGTITLGAGLKIGYFAQAHDGLDLSSTVLDEFMRHRPMLVSEARNFLAQYLFRADDVYKQVGMLSGGERGKLALAVLASRGSNFLLLDEPTNHLDIPAQEVLQEVLEQFEGTILLVSHDRYLIDRLATQIWTLENGRVSVFKGPYQEYIAARDAEREAAKLARRNLNAMPAPPPRPSNGTAHAGGDARTDKKKREQLARLEAQIHSLESSLKELERLLEKSSAAGQVETVQRLGAEYAEQQSKLETLMESWTAAAG